MSDRTEALMRSIQKGKELADKIERLPVDPRDLKTAEGRKATLSAIRRQLREQAGELADLARKKALEAAKKAINDHGKLKDEISRLLGSDDWVKDPGRRLPAALLDKYRASRALREKALAALGKTRADLPKLPEQIETELAAIAEKQAIRHGPANALRDAAKQISDDSPIPAVLIECGQPLRNLEESMRRFAQDQANAAKALQEKSVPGKIADIDKQLPALEKAVADAMAEAEKYDKIFSDLRQDQRALGRIAEQAEKYEKLNDALMEKIARAAEKRDELLQRAEKAQNAISELKRLRDQLVSEAKKLR